MTISLFRQNAINHLKQRLHGDVLLLPQTSAVVLTNSIVLWVIACLVWLALGNYARKETVQGWLEPPSGIAKISAPQQGIIQAILVADGAKVQKGDALMRIGTERQLTDGRSVEQALLSQYSQQLDDIDVQQAHLQAIYRVESAALDKAIQVGQSDVERINQQYIALQQREVLVNNRLQRLRNMHILGHIAQHDIDLLSEQQLGLRGEILSLERERSAARSHVSQLLSERQILPQTHEQQITQLNRQVGELQQHITQVSGQQEYIISAPKDGFVTNLHARLGQTVATQQPLMTILPSDADLQAQMLIPVRAAGFLFPGQKVDIRYDAFPYQKFGLYRGTLSAVSNTVVLPNELTNAPVAFQEPVYLVSVELDSTYIHAFGEKVQLKSDMTFSADIEISERSLLEWIIEPILSLQGKL
ncbi:HlyD family efflux transporter periplasmic adaptor subunit [Alteromonas oceanisediminis]|uniref:HlyD family efflux transporter periplasmic adaptor subunit n=1 Tax=Alteromonas oceanisediminis TaxID=2836180 RepID=UPI001BD94ED4|nr:HlyD family efflux transporter periplasmic adaptor subunit [Alteromonas oceanisediminis]MBT0587720.1 HlyD family efflux transporter periplasmic adaptor subunit [Alteromonas oceanisediminis]